MPKQKSEGTQQTQTVQQSTTVNVQNTIESPELTPLQNVQILADIATKFDQLDVAKKAAQAGQTGDVGQNVVVTNIPAAAFLNPKTILIVSAAALLLILAAKKL